MKKKATYEERKESVEKMNYRGATAPKNDLRARFKC